MTLSLHFTAFEAKTDRQAVPLVMAHGLLGQGRNFGTLAREFSESRTVYVVDMRNHGDSPWDEAMDYPAMAADLAAFIEREAGGRAHVFGHSMGGKAAMRLALDAPERVAGLVVADIAPVAYTHSHAAEIDALRALDLDALSRRGDADAALKTDIEDRTLRAFLLQNLRFSPDGTSRRSNLDVLAGVMDTLVGWDDPGARPFTNPALFIAGGASPYVLPEHEPAIATLFPDSRIERIAGGGHWIHAEKPREVHDLTAAFLSEADAA